MRSKDGHSVIRLGVLSSLNGHIRLFSADAESGTSSICILKVDEHGGLVTVQGKDGMGHLFSGGVMVSDKDGKVLLDIRGAD